MNNMSSVSFTGRTRILCLAVLTLARTNFAQFGHSDVDLALADGKIVTNQRVYESFFPTFGIARQFSTNPGFAAESDGLGTISPNQDLVYDVLDDLLLWDGTDFLSLPEEIRIRVDNNPPGSTQTEINSASGIQLGSINPPINRIGPSSASGEVHSHVNFFLEPQDGEEPPPFGAYGMKISLTTSEERLDESEPIFLVFNFGMDEAAFEQSLVVYEELLDEPELLGDFNLNGELDVDDIDLLTTAVATDPPDTNFDLNSDSMLDAEDRRIWVEELRGTYFGDSTLDGEFSSADLVAIFQRGKYEDDLPMNATWADGDWNGDGDFSSSDLVLAFQSGGYELGPRQVLAVPESNGSSFLTCGLIAVLVVCPFSRKQATRCFPSICTDAQTNLLP